MEVFVFKSNNLQFIFLIMYAIYSYVKVKQLMW